MASTTPLSHRIVTFILAVLFIGSTIGIVIYYVLQNRNLEKQQAAINAALQQQNKPQEGKLQGSPLQNFTPTAKIETLKTEDTVVGTGAEVKTGDTITAHYTGAVASTGTVFQSSHDSGQPISFSLNQVIAGWSQGVPGMKVGGTRRIYIPASLAYGANPPAGSGIPANADLVFDVELVKIGQ
jgi:FKBP-type peptidyl-prolyl cis-trans isomerase